MRGLDSSGSEEGPVASSCERDNKSSGSIKRWGTSWPTSRDGFCTVE